MMTYRNFLLRFLSQTLTLFGVNILLLLILAKAFGDGAKTISSLYQFGASGLAASTILQFLLSSALIIAFKYLFYSERIFKKLMTLWRTILMLFSVLLTNIVFIYLFDWFSFENASGWIGFILCFTAGCVFGALVLIIKTRLESKQYEELLANYKSQQERDVNNE